MEDNRKPLQEDELNIFKLIETIWSRKWFIGKIVLVFTILGLVIAFTSPREFIASSTLIPEATNQQGNIGGSLGGLASLAGVDLGNMGGSSSINPALYQSVSRSTPFLLELMKQEYYFSEVGKEISIYDYYVEHYKVSLVSWVLSVPGKLISFIKPKRVDNTSPSLANHNILSLSKVQQGIVKDLISRVLVVMDWELGVVRIEVEMQDPVVAALMTQFTRDYITDYVSNYAIAKTKQELTSIEIKYQERKIEFEKSQLALAKFRDGNKYVTTSQAKSEEERLQSEYNLALSIYNQLAQQRETLELRIQEDTPIFTVLEPVKVPVDNSSPKKALILFIFTAIGFFSGSAFVIIYEQQILRQL